MRVAGAFLSGIGHAGVIALAAAGPPFLWAPPDRPVPAVFVTLLTAAELAAMVPAPPQTPAQPPATPAVAPPPMPPPLVLPKTMEPEATVPPTTLAPGFGAESSLDADEMSAVGSVGDGAAGLAPAVEMPPEDPEALRAVYAAQVRKAVARARIYPQVARDRGLEGTVGFQLVLGPDGRLLAAQRLRSSGAMTLDRAALETVRRAAYPPAPEGLGGERLTIDVDVVFAGSDR